jgi:hypothetical protein
MKRTFTLILTFLILNVTSFGQNLDSLLLRTSIYIDEITESRPEIDETIFLINSCPGEIYSWEEIKKGSYKTECKYEGIYYRAYVFTIAEDRMTVKRFDPCYSFQELTLDSEVKDYYFNKHDSILSSEIKPQQCIEINGTDTSYYTTFSHHSCFSEITWLSNADTVKHAKFRLEDYVEERYVGEPNPNINAKFNASLPLLIWHSEIMDEFLEMENKRKFKK